MRKKPHFTHGRGNLRSDVSRKRFSTHVMERNVARIGEAGVETTKGCQVLGERMESVSVVRCGIAQGGSCGVRMESKYGEDGKCVGCEIWDCAGWEPWVWEQGTTRVRAREEPMVRW